MAETRKQRGFEQPLGGCGRSGSLALERAMGGGRMGVPWTVVGGEAKNQRRSKALD